MIVASKGGAPDNPTWLGNIIANPDVEVEIASPGGTEKFRARAQVVQDPRERDRLFQDMTVIWPSYTDYQNRTERLIPVVVLERRRP